MLSESGVPELQTLVEPDVLAVLEEEVLLAARAGHDHLVGHGVRLRRLKGHAVVVFTTVGVMSPRRYLLHASSDDGELPAKIRSGDWFQLPQAIRLNLPVPLDS